MAVIRINIDGDTLEQLQSAAQAERRPLQWQAEVCLRRYFGLPFPPAPLQFPTNKLDAEHEKAA